MSGSSAPLTRAQAAALGRAVGLELAWGLRLARRERAVWRRHAARIPDPELRADALRALTRKKHYTDGAALFWTLPDRRDPRLLRLLVSFQIAADYLDHASERGAARRGRSAGSLIGALVDAVDVEAVPGDYYADHPWRNDGGYLRALVSACQAGCATSPGYDRSRLLLVEHARRLHALELHHDPVPERRDRGLRRYATEVFGEDGEMTWIECVGSASSAMTVIATLACRTDAACTDDELSAVVDAYTWVGALAAMLDGYVDQAEDARSGDWSSVGYYADVADAEARIEFLIERTFQRVGALRKSERHSVIVAAMIAMYLSHHSVGGRRRSASARRMVRAGGSLTRLLVPGLRAWRAVQGQRRA